MKRPRSKSLRELHRDPAAREVVRRAAARDRRTGSGDSMDFALLVYDEARRRFEAMLRDFCDEHYRRGYAAREADERDGFDACDPDLWPPKAERTATFDTETRPDDQPWFVLDIARHCDECGDSASDDILDAHGGCCSPACLLKRDGT